MLGANPNQSAPTNLFSHNQDLKRTPTVPSLRLRQGSFSLRAHDACHASYWSGKSISLKFALQKKKPGGEPGFFNTKTGFGKMTISLY